jgi:hypothetical protein
MSYYQSDPGLGLQNQNQNFTSPDHTDVRPGTMISDQGYPVGPTDVRPGTMISGHGNQPEMTFGPNGSDQPTLMSDFPVPQSGQSTTMSGMGGPGSTQGTNTNMSNFGISPGQDWPSKAPTEVNPALSGNHGNVQSVPRQQEPTIVGDQNEMVMSHMSSGQGQGKNESTYEHLYSESLQQHQQNQPPPQQHQQNQPPPQQHQQNQPPPQQLVYGKLPAQPQGQQQPTQQHPGHPQQQPQPSPT